MSTDNNSKGIVLIIIAMTLFAMQDSLIKFIFEKAASVSYTHLTLPTILLV